MDMYYKADMSLFLNYLWTFCFWQNEVLYILKKNVETDLKVRGTLKASVGKRTLFEVHPDLQLLIHLLTV